MENSTNNYTSDLNAPAKMEIPTKDISYLTNNPNQVTELSTKETINLNNPNQVMENSTKDAPNLEQPNSKDEESSHEYQDKGWAWVVAFAACICNFILIGSGKGMGVMLNAVVEKFQMPAAFSITMFVTVGSTMPCTVLSSHLTNYVPCRYLVHGGGALIIVGNLLTAFASSIYMVYIGLGFFCGAGGGFVIPASYVIINQYFKQKRSKGLAMATVGGGIGSLTFSPVMGALFEYYGYMGALLVITAIYSHIQVAGALMRPPPKPKAEKNDSKAAQNGGYKPEVAQNGGQGSDAQQNGGFKPEVTQNGGQKPEVEQNGGHKSEVAQNGGLKPIFDEESPLINKNDEQISPTAKRSRLQLLKNGTFLLYLFDVGTCLLPATIIYLPAFGLEIGISTKVSSWILSLNGLSDIIGRVTSGFLFDKIRHGRKRITHSTIGIIIGTITLCIGFIDTLLSLCVFAFVVGFFEAMFNAQRTAIPFEFVPAEDMGNALGLIFLAEYIGTLLGPVMHGVLNGRFGTYTIGYIIGGTLFTFASLIMCVDYVRIKYRNRRSA